MDVALITGASAGLGTIFAKRLAAQKQNLVLVARRKDRLEELAQDLRKAHGVSVFVETADLSAPGAVPILMNRLVANKLEVTTLINNAGFGSNGPFAKQDVARQTEMINLNCTALMQLCHAVLPAMQKRKSGGILNVASVAAFLAGPGMSVYYASKAFVLSFSEALHEEVKNDGIMVSCLCPGPTKTEFFVAADAANIGLTKLAVSPERVVDDGLRGLERNKAIMVSGLRNKIQVVGGKLAPRSVTRKIAASLQQ